MFGSKLARLPRPFIKQSAVPNAINQNLRPKISNYAYHNSLTATGVQGTVNHSFYFMPDSSTYQEMYNYSQGGGDNSYQGIGSQHNSLDLLSLKKTKDEILRAMSSISKSGGDIESQVMMLLSLPYELDIRDYTKAIQSCNNIHLSSVLMEELHKRGLIPDLLLFNVYLKKCEDFREKEEAFHIYHQLLDDNVIPDKHTMIILIRCCLQSNCPRDAENVMSDAFNRSIEVNSYMFNLVIDYFARRNQPSEAFRLRLQMNVHSILPDEYTVSSLMAACCPQLPSRAHLLILLEDVKSSPLPARSVCASALFSGIAKAPHLENHQKLKIIVSFFDALRSRGYVLGQHAYTSLMACCAKLGALEQAKLFLQDMRSSGVEPNQYILTAFISTCSKAKDYGAALGVFNFMRGSRDSRDNKRRPNKYTYEAMLVAAGNAGSMQDALQIYSDMVGEGIVPDTSTYARLVIVCGLCGDLRQGLLFQEEFNRKHLPRTSFFYHAVIDLYSRCHQLDSALSVLKEVRSSGTVEASHHHYEPIVRLMVETNEWERVDALLATWSEISYTTLQYLIINSYKQQLWSRVLLYEAKMRSNGQRPYSALLPIIDNARKMADNSDLEVISPVTPASPTMATIPREETVMSEGNTMQFLEGKVGSIPEFVPMRLRSAAVLPRANALTTTAALFYPALSGTGLDWTDKTTATWAGKYSSWGDGDFGLLGEGNLSLDDLDCDLTTDFDFFNDMESVY